MFIKTIVAAVAISVVSVAAHADREHHQNHHGGHYQEDRHHGNFKQQSLAQNQPTRPKCSTLKRLIIMAIQPIV